MEKKKTNSSYLNLTIGAIGMLLLVFGLLEYILFVGNTTTPFIRK